MFTNLANYGAPPCRGTPMAWETSRHDLGQHPQPWSLEENQRIHRWKTSFCTWQKSEYLCCPLKKSDILNS